MAVKNHTLTEKVEKPEEKPEEKPRGVEDSRKWAGLGWVWAALDYYDCMSKNNFCKIDINKILRLLITLLIVYNTIAKYDFCPAKCKP